MPALREVIQSLTGPLALEVKKGYPDTAVMGRSMADYARGWAERASAVLTEQQAALVQEVAAKLSGYRKASVKQRGQLITEAMELLKRLELPETPIPPEPAKKTAAKPATKRTTSPKRPPAEPVTPAEWLDQSFVEGRLRNASWPKKLAHLGLVTRRDLLYYFPRDYLPVKRVDDLVDGDRAAVVVTTGPRQEAVVKERRGFRLIRYTLEVRDDSGKAWVTSFAKVPRFGAKAQAMQGSPLTLSFPEDALLLIEGSVKRAGWLIELQYGSSERVSEAAAPPPGTLTPIYPLTEGVYQGQVRPALRQLVANLPEELPDPLPESLRREYGLLGLREALQGIHFPASSAEQEAARYRLALEELLTLQLALAQRKKQTQQPGAGISMPPRGDPVAALEEILPFSLTRAQQRAIAEIAADMAADVPMSRMVQGDVGSGKTVVAATALLIALQNGYQGALMAPTELLAEQHFLVLSRLLEPLGVRVELLTGSLSVKDRAKTYAQLADGRTQIAVGTHALIQEGVQFHKLGLVIVDEQHRFGVRQRAGLREKGLQPDLLVMTATPIPRSLALTLYGDLDLSVLDELPPGRTPITTRWIPLHQVEETYDFIRQQISNGRQAFVVCPLVEESEKLAAEAATKLAEQLQREIYPDLEIGLLHGNMAVAEKDTVMGSFRRGEKQILCATTVIEVGMDVPNATVMLVMNAERFGLAQLHQLRGRVGRGAHESHCLLVTDKKYHPLGRITPSGEDLVQARDRLKVLLETTDGFVIAEQDLLQRGPGEFYGTRQHGLPDFRLARLAGDLGLLERAREIANSLIAQDLELMRPEHTALRQQVAALRARMDAVAG